MEEDGEEDFLGWDAMSGDDDSLWGPLLLLVVVSSFASSSTGALSCGSAPTIVAFTIRLIYSS